MKVLDYEVELEEARKRGFVDGGFSSQMPKDGSEFSGYINTAIELACKAFDYPKVEGFDWGEPGFRFDGYHTDTFTFTVYFRIDKDCPFMVRFDGIDHYDPVEDDEVGQYTGKWMAQSTSIHQWAS